MTRDEPLPTEPHPIMPAHLHNPRVQQHLTEFKALIRHCYPEARFTIFEGEDPVGVYLRVYLADDEVDIPSSVWDHLLDILEREGLAFYIVTSPLQRVPPEAA